MLIRGEKFEQRSAISAWSSYFRISREIRYEVVLSVQGNTTPFFTNRIEDKVGIQVSFARQ